MTYAFAVPIPPRRTDEVRAFFAELLGPSRADYEDMCRRSGVSAESYWLQTDPSGDLLVVASNSDQQEFLAILANPVTDFDRWMADRVRVIFGMSAEPTMAAANEPLGELRLGE
jgi:hypothetical protein